jgi:hypothetical protein
MARSHASLLGPGQPLELPRPGRSAAPFAAIAAAALLFLLAPGVPRVLALAAAVAFGLAAAARAVQEQRELGRLRSSLDRLLLRKALPDAGSPLLVWRAGELSSVDERDHLAASLRRIEKTASAGRLPGAAPLKRAAVRAHEDQIDAIVDLLLGPDPVCARGVLLVRRLLDDPGGPLYDEESSATLGDDLRAALEALDG